MTLRLVSLGRVAAEAEGLRAKAFAKRQAMRGAYGAVAAIFALFVLIMLHISILEFLIPVVGGGFAGLILVGVDAVAAGAFAVLASKNVPSQAEREAALISRQARGQMADVVSTFAVLTPVARLISGKGIRSTLMSAAATRWITRRRRR